MKQCIEGLRREDPKRGAIDLALPRGFPSLIDETYGTGARGAVTRL
jgi:hypothetical protein